MSASFTFVLLLSCQQLLSVPRPPTQNKGSPTPPPPRSCPSPNLISMTTTTTTTTASSPGQPAVDLLTDMGSSTTAEVSPWHSSPQQPSLGDDPQKTVKENIMSLYSGQGQGSSGMGYHQVRCLSLSLSVCQNVCMRSACPSLCREVSLSQPVS